jgi:hypothetical protein
MLVFSLAGCGFHRVAADDGVMTAAASDLGTTDPGATDLGATDGGATDGNVASTGGIGPGPLGALPAGFCCNSNADCRSRSCAGLFDPVHYCTDECDHNSLCSAYGGNFICDGNGTGYCATATTPATCVDPSLYHYGAKPIGSCCQSGFDKSGQECLGGLCVATGPSTNPFFCTQGCDRDTPCPASYVCNSVGFCSLPDPNAAYACH